MWGRFAHRPYALSEVKRSPGDKLRQTRMKTEKETELSEGRWSSQVADLNDKGEIGENCFLDRKMDRWGWGRGFFDGSLERLGFSGYTQLAGFLPLRLGHVTSLREVPGARAHMQAGPSGGGGKNHHPG